MDCRNCGIEMGEKVRFCRKCAAARPDSFAIATDFSYSGGAPLKPAADLPHFEKKPVMPATGSAGFATRAEGRSFAGKGTAPDKAQAAPAATPPPSAQAAPPPLPELSPSLPRRRGQQPPMRQQPPARRQPSAQQGPPPIREHEHHDSFGYEGSQYPRPDANEKRRGARAATVFVVIAIIIVMSLVNAIRNNQYHDSVNWVASPEPAPEFSVTHIPEIEIDQGDVLTPEIEEEAPPLQVVGPPDVVLDYTAPEELGEDLISFNVRFAGYLYNIPAPVDAFIENGWSLMENGVYLGPLTEEYLLMEKDDELMLATIFNFSDITQPAEYCFVTSIYSSDFGPDLPIELPGGVTMDSTLEEVVAIYGEPDSFSDFNGIDSLFYWFYDKAVVIEITRATGRISYISLSYFSSELGN